MVLVLNFVLLEEYLTQHAIEQMPDLRWFLIHRLLCLHPILDVLEFLINLALNDAVRGVMLFHRLILNQFYSADLCSEYLIFQLENLCLLIRLLLKIHLMNLVR